MINLISEIKINAFDNYFFSLVSIKAFFNDPIEEIRRLHLRSFDDCDVFDNFDNINGAEDGVAIDLNSFKQNGFVNINQSDLETNMLMRNGHSNKFLQRTNSFDGFGQSEQSLHCGCNCSDWLQGFDDEDINDPFRSINSDRSELNAIAGTTECLPIQPASDSVEKNPIESKQSGQESIRNGIISNNPSSILLNGFVSLNQHQHHRRASNSMTNDLLLSSTGSSSSTSSGTNLNNKKTKFEQSNSFVSVEKNFSHQSNSSTLTINGFHPNPSSLTSISQTMMTNKSIVNGSINDVKANEKIRINQMSLQQQQQHQLMMIETKRFENFTKIPSLSGTSSGTSSMSTNSSIGTNVMSNCEGLLNRSALNDSQRSTSSPTGTTPTTIASKTSTPTSSMGLSLWRFENPGNNEIMMMDKSDNVDDGVHHLSPSSSSIHPPKFESNSLETNSLENGFNDADDKNDSCDDKTNCDEINLHLSHRNHHSSSLTSSMTMQNQADLISASFKSPNTMSRTDQSTNKGFNELQRKALVATKSDNDGAPIVDLLQEFDVSFGTHGTDRSTLRNSETLTSSTLLQNEEIIDRDGFDDLSMVSCLSFFFVAKSIRFIFYILDIFVYSCFKLNEIKGLNFLISL